MRPDGYLLPLSVHFSYCGTAVRHFLVILSGLKPDKMTGKNDRISIVIHRHDVCTVIRRVAVTCGQPTFSEDYNTHFFNTLCHKTPDIRFAPGKRFARCERNFSGWAFARISLMQSGKPLFGVSGGSMRFRPGRRCSSSFVETAGRTTGSSPIYYAPILTALERSTVASG